MLGITRFFTMLFSVFLLNIVAMTASATTYITAEPNNVGLIDIEIKTAYQSTETAGYTVDGSRRLHRIDLVTGNATLVGSLGVSGDFEALAFSPNGALYALEDSSNKLYTLNLVTGAATLVGSTGINSTSEPGMAFDDNGRLWVIGGGSGRVWEVNPATAIASFIGSTGISRAWALAFHDNTFYTVADSSKHLYRIDTETATATPVGSLGISFNSQHGMSSDGHKLWLLTESGSKLYTLNTQTGNATASSGVFGASSLESLAITTNPPLLNVSIAVLDLPSWLSLHDNGDGTARIQGYPVLDGGYEFTLRITDSSGSIVDKTYSVSTQSVINPIEVDENGDLLDEEEEGYDYSNKEKTVIEESAGAIDYFFALMFMLIASLRFQRRKS